MAMRSRRLEHGLRRPPGRVLSPDFYARDTLTVARELLGCLLCRREENGQYSFGPIVETEAYIGEDDPACHAAAGLTPRTRILYGSPGHAYVYFSYGMHFLLNAVTEPKDSPAAVLIRAMEPEGGLLHMERRRGKRSFREIASGPARLCQALAIDLELNGFPLGGPELEIRDPGLRESRIESGPRVGIRRGTDRRWRFWVAGNPHVSKGAIRLSTPRRARTRSSATA